MDLGQDSYTTAAQVQTYLNRTLEANETASLAIVIPAVSRWIDRTLNSCFDKLDVNDPNSWKTRYMGGGYQEINIQHCQRITAVQAVNPYDLSVWYTYSTPLEYMAEPYNLPVKTSLRMKVNEFTGNDLKWPGDAEGIAVTALFTEYDYVNDKYPSDIVLLANHVSAVWLQNSDNTDAIQRESVEGHLVIKQLDDMLDRDPMVTRVLESRQEVWLDEM